MLFRQKLVASLPTLKLHLSDEKIIMLADFVSNIPKPTSSSMAASFIDSPDGTMEPILPVAHVLVSQLDISPLDLDNINLSNAQATFIQSTRTQRFLKTI